MHGTDERPSNLAASSLESPSTTTLSLPTRRGTLNPSVLIEFAISRTCAGSDLRSLRTCDFKASTGRARSEAKEGCRFGGACFLFPLPHALPLPPGVNAPSPSNLHAGCRAASHPYPSCFDPGSAVFGSCGFCLKGTPG